MNIEKYTAKLFQMSDEEWMRHANPWSGWTRMTCLPLLFMAIWSRKWLRWLAVIPVSIALFWIWINPRVFKKPASTNYWMSKVTFGERVMANRENVPVPEHHLPVLKVTRLITAIGMVSSVYGLAKLKAWPALFGLVLTMLGKTWYMDRMVWLYEEVKDDTLEYREWLY